MRIFIILGLCALFLCISIPCTVLFFVNTRIAGGILQSAINDRITGSLNWQKHKLSLFRGTLELKKILLKDSQNQDIVSCDRVVVDLSLFSLLKKRIHLSTLVLDNPWISLTIDTAGRVNVVEAFSKQAAPQQSLPDKENESAKPPFTAISADNIVVHDGHFFLSVEAEKLHAEMQNIFCTGSGNLHEKLMTIALQTGHVDFRTPQAHINSETFDGYLSYLGGHIDSCAIDLQLPQSKLSVSGSAKNILQTPELNVRCVLSIHVSELASMFALDSTFSGTSTLTGTMTGSIDNPEITVHGTGSSIEIYDYKSDTVACRFSLRNKMIIIDTVLIGTGGGFLSSSGLVDCADIFPEGLFSAKRQWDAIRYSCNLALNQVQLEQLYPPLQKNVQGVLWADVTVKGKGVSAEKLAVNSTIQVHADSINVSSNTLPSQFNRFDGNMDIACDDGVVTIGECILQTPQIRISAAGTYAIGNKMVDARITLDTARLSAMLPASVSRPLDGYVSSSLHVYGSQHAPWVQGDIEATHITYAADTLGQIQAAFSLDTTGLLTLKDLTIENNRSLVSATGTAQLFKVTPFAFNTNPVFSLHVDGDTVYIDDFVNDAYGAVQLRASLNGNFNALYGTAKLHAAKLDLGVQKADRFAVHLTLDSQTVYIDSILCAIDQNDLFRGNGWITRSLDYQVQISSPGIQLSHIDKLKSYDAFDGVCSFTMSGKGTVNNPAVSANITLRQLHVNNKRLDDCTISFALKDSVAKVTGAMDFTFSGIYHLGNKHFSIKTLFQNMECSPYFAIAGLNDFHGTLSGDMEISGASNALEQVNGYAQLNSIKLFHIDVPLVSSEYFHLLFHNQSLHIPGIELILLNDGHASIHGSARLNGSLAISIDADVPFHLIGYITDDLEQTNGAIRIDAALNGNTSSPVLAGTVALQQIGFRIPGIEQMIHGIDGTIACTPSLIQSDAIRGKLDNGKFEISGKMTLERFRPDSVFVALTAHTLALQVPDMLSTAVNASLAMKGTFEKALIEGQLYLLEGIFYSDIDDPIYNVLQKSRETAPKRPTATNSFVNNTQYDVVIIPRQNFIVDNNLALLKIKPDLRIKGTLLSPVINGKADVLDGMVKYRGNTFTVDKGIIDFVSPYVTTPMVDIVAGTRVGDDTIVLEITGFYTSPVFNLYGENLTTQRVLEDEEIVSLLLTGQTITDLRNKSKETIVASAEEMIKELVNTLVEENIKSVTGLDEFNLKTEGNLFNTIEVTVGKNLSKRLLTRYSINTNNGNLTQQAIVEYKLLENILLKTFNDTEGKFGGEAQVHFEFP